MLNFKSFLKHFIPVSYFKVDELIKEIKQLEILFEENSKELHRRFDEAKNDLGVCESNLKEKVDELHRRFDEIKNDLNVVASNKVTDLDVRIGNNVARLFTANNLNMKAFSNYKNAFKNKSVVIVGAGPTVNDFVPIKDCIYIGLNRAFKLETVKFDFLFSIDKAGIENYYEDFFSYDCIKFIGDQNVGKDYQIPESVLPNNNIFRYITTAGQFADRFTYHIDSEPVGNFVTVSLQAMQFALFTNPSKIYLVGIDCSEKGHFSENDYQTKKRTSDEFKKNSLRSIEDWKNLKSFASIYYPDTEIISVNPVGLKGIFTDLYQTESGGE